MNTWIIRYLWQLN